MFVVFLMEQLQITTGTLLIGKKTNMDIGTNVTLLDVQKQILMKDTLMEQRLVQNRQNVLYVANLMEI